MNTELRHHLIAQGDLPLRLTADEVGAVIGRSRSQVYRLSRAGTLPAQGDDGRWALIEIRGWLESQHRLKGDAP